MQCACYGVSRLEDPMKGDLVSPENYDNVRCVLFDFADTLCHTPYFWTLGPEFTSTVTEAIFTGENKRLWAGPWCQGQISSGDIAAYLSELSGISPALIMDELFRGCSCLRMNPSVLRFAQDLKLHGKKIALVTINMDVFSMVVSPTHGLDDLFDVVINSSDYGVDDKHSLCTLAFERLGDCSFPQGLLIDDSIKAIESFRESGGLAYQYTDENAFSEWVQIVFPFLIQP